MQAKLFFLLLFILASKIIFSQEFDPKYYQTGNPVTKDLWVDPVNGNDNNDGSSKTNAFRSISAAWQSIPLQFTNTGFRIKLARGDFAYRDVATNAIVGLYLDDRQGTFNNPIIIESGDGPLTAHLYSSLDFRNVKYVYLIGLDFKTDPSSDGGGNTIHFAAADHILLKNCTVNGSDGTQRKSQETLKVNQTSYMYVEDCDISGAFWFSLDFVAVQYGHIQNCKIHDASEDALLIKGGSTQIRIEGNFIYNADRFGFSAGQGSGFDFLVFPWLHYEAYNLKFINNVVYNTGYAGVAFLGAYDVLCAFNTLYKVGINQDGDRTLISVNLGQRGCDGAEPDTCTIHHNKGGWSPGQWSDPSVPDGTEMDCIPNKNVFIYNNIFYNPFPDSTIGPHLEVRGLYDGSDYSANFLSSSNIINPALSDDNLRIAGNIIWNGDKEKEIGITEDSGCQDSNTGCNRTKIISENAINKTEPDFINAAKFDFHPKAGGYISNYKGVEIPKFISTDRPSRPIPPIGNLSNKVFRGIEGFARGNTNSPGAYTTSNVDIKNQKNTLPVCFELFQNYPNPFNPETVISYQIPKAGIVTLRVYDVLGREIGTLVNDYLHEGIHKSIFNAQHYSLASGIYFYQLRSGTFVKTKNFVLMK